MRMQPALRVGSHVAAASEHSDQSSYATNTAVKRIG
jgi:hypothetical protein